MRIEQVGSESTELSANGSFVLVHVPATVAGELSSGVVGLRFSIGSFQGRETRLLLGGGAQTKLTYRIAKELFRPRERLSLEVFARDDNGSEEVLWTRRYDASWRGKVPYAEPMADYLSEAPADEV